MKPLVKLLLVVGLMGGIGVTRIDARDLKTNAIDTATQRLTAEPIVCSAENAEAPIVIAQTCPGEHTCITTACGVMSDQVYCCPFGHRYLNHCDCLCYTSSYDINCNSYTRCN